MLVALLCSTHQLCWAINGNTTKNETSSTKPEKVSVLLLNPSIKNDPFWHKIETITKQAAAEFNYELSVIYGQGTRYFQLEELKKYFTQSSVPNYIILMNYPGHAQLTMEYLKNYKVKIITLEQTIINEERVTIGKPGENYKNWIGEIYFNNANAGYLLAKDLINTGKKQKMNPVVAGISGHYGSESNLRNKGLKLAVEESGAQLTQIVHAGWSAEDAYKKTHRLLKRYPNINILWCASDHMALGAVKAIEDSGKQVGKDVLIGGFDWTPKAITSIQQNKLTASIGGHFIMGGVAIMAIYNEEHEQAHHFFVTDEKNSFELAVINQVNVSQYNSLLQNDGLKHVSFHELIKLYDNPKAQSSINLLKALKKASQQHPVNNK